MQILPVLAYTGIKGKRGCVVRLHVAGWRGLLDGRAADGPSIVTLQCFVNGALILSKRRMVKKPTFVL